MIKKNFIYLISIFFIAFSSHSFGLSFGEIKVRSHFAQAFNAEINIPSYTEDEIDNVSIQLASKSEFAKRGLEFQPILEDFRFKLEKRKNGSLFILVTSVLAVKELSVNLLVEVTWPSGRIIKQYDVLLTPEAISELWEEKQNLQTAELPLIAPPLLIASTTSPTIKPDATMTRAPKAQQTTVQMPVANITSAAPQTDNQTIRKMSDGSLRYSAVKPGDTLSVLAQAFRPDSNMSLQQVMVALFQQNRNAFLNDNINKLQAGVPLILQDFDKIWQVSRKEAIAFLDRISGDNRNAPKNLMTASMAGTESENIFNNSSRLQIAQLDEDVIPDDVMREIQNDQIDYKQTILQRTRTEAEKLQKQNEELRKRIAELEAQIDKSAEKLFLNSAQSGNTEALLEAQKLAIQQSNTQQDESLIVTNSDIVMPVEDKPSNESDTDYTVPGVIAIILLLIFLFGARNKSQIVDAIERYKQRKSKDSNYISFNS